MYKIPPHHREGAVLLYVVLSAPPGAANLTLSDSLFFSDSRVNDNQSQMKGGAQEKESTYLALR